MTSRHNPTVVWEVAGLFNERVIEWQIHFGALLPPAGRQALYRNAVGFLIVDNSNGAYAELSARQPVVARLIIDGIVAWSGMAYPEGGPETLASHRLRWELKSRSAGALADHIEIVSSAATAPLKDIRDAWQTQTELTLGGAIPADVVVGPIMWSGRASRMLDAIGAYGSGWVVERFNGFPYFAHHATLKASTTAKTLSRAFRPLARTTRIVSTAANFGGSGRFQGVAVQASAPKELGSKSVTFTAGRLTRTVYIIVRNEIFTVASKWTISQNGTEITTASAVNQRTRRREAAGTSFDYLSADVTVPSAGDYDISVTGATGELTQGAIGGSSVTIAGLDGFTVPDIPMPPWYPVTADHEIDPTMAGQASNWIATIASGLARGRLAYPMIQPAGQFRDLITIGPGDAIQAETAGFWRLWLVLGVTYQGGRDRGGRVFLDVVELGDIKQTEPVTPEPYPAQPDWTVKTSDGSTVPNNEICIDLPAGTNWDIFRSPQTLWQFRPDAIVTVATNQTGGTTYCDKPGTGDWDYRICPTGTTVNGAMCSSWFYTRIGPDHGSPTPADLRFTLSLVGVAPEPPPAGGTELTRSDDLWLATNITVWSSPGSNQLLARMGGQSAGSSPQRLWAWQSDGTIAKFTTFTLNSGARAWEASAPGIELGTLWTRAIVWPAA